MRSKIKIFEANRKDGIMSSRENFYPENTTKEEIEKIFYNTRIKLGEKLGIDGRHIFKCSQKWITNNIKYRNGKYIVLEDKHMKKEDYYQEYLPADILIINKKYKNIIVGHSAADCPIIICEDRENGFTAISHCGGSYIDRGLARDTIKALIEVSKCKKENIYVYVSSCIKKQSYIYDRYPLWAKHKKVWKDHIKEKKGNYYIDLIGALKEELNKEEIKHIKISPINTATHPDYASHSEAVKGKKEKLGQNFFGFYYK